MQTKLQVQRKGRVAGVVERSLGDRHAAIKQGHSSGRRFNPARWRDRHIQHAGVPKVRDRGGWNQHGLAVSLRDADVRRRNSLRENPCYPFPGFRIRHSHERRR